MKAREKVVSVCKVSRVENWMRIFNHMSEKVSYRCCAERSARRRLGMRPN